MESIINLVLGKGLWPLVVGIITSILIGAIKTPIKKAVIKDGLEEKTKLHRENVFDTLVFLGSFVMAFLGAMVYSLILSRAFLIMDIIGFTPYVWLAQSMVYGIWKKLGLKRLLQLILKLLVKDRNKDGKISLDEAIAMVKDAFKNGKLDVDELLKNSIENVCENIENVLTEATEGIEVDKASEAVKQAVEGDSSKLVETIKESAESLVNPEKTISSEVEVAKPGSTIKF